MYGSGHYRGLPALATLVLRGEAVTIAVAPAVQRLNVSATVRPTATSMVFVFHFIKVDLSPGSEKPELIENWNPQRWKIL